MGYWLLDLLGRDDEPTSYVLPSTRRGAYRMLAGVALLALAALATVILLFAGDVLIATGVCLVGSLPGFLLFTNEADKAQAERRAQRQGEHR